MVRPGPDGFFWQGVISLPSEVTHWAWGWFSPSPVGLLSMIFCSAGPARVPELEEVLEGAQGQGQDPDLRRGRVGVGHGVRRGVPDLDRGQDCTWADRCSLRPL
jgi:hypothetical protein